MKTTLWALGFMVHLWGRVVRWFDHLKLKVEKSPRDKFKINCKLKRAILHFEEHLVPLAGRAETRVEPFFIWVLGEEAGHISSDTVMHLVKSFNQ